MKTYIKDDDGNFNLVNEIEALKTIKLTEGIWNVRTILKGREYTFVTDKIKELPEKMDLVRFLPYKYKIATEIKRRLDEAEMSNEYGIDDKVKVGEIMKIIGKVIGSKNKSKN